MRLMRVELRFYLPRFARMSSPSTELSEAPGPPASTDEPLTSLDMPSLLSDLGGGATSQKEQQSSDSVAPSVRATMSTLEMMGSGSEPLRTRPIPTRRPL